MAGPLESGEPAYLLQPRALLPTQSLPEEEQQRVLGEEKMLNISKKQTTSPASKKPSQEGGKVSATGQWGWGLGWSRSCEASGNCTSDDALRASLRVAPRSPSGLCLPCSSSQRRREGSYRKNDLSSQKAS